MKSDVITLHAAANDKFHSESRSPAANANSSLGNEQDFQGAYIFHGTPMLHKREGRTLAWPWAPRCTHNLRQKKVVRGGVFYYSVVSWWGRHVLHVRPAVL